MSDDLTGERDDASTSRLEDEPLTLEEDEPIFGSTRELPSFSRTLVSDKRYYSLLNLEEDAGDTDISKSYKALAVLLHPDRAPEHLRESATQRFEEVHRAYEVLSDGHKRAVYDLLGEEALKTNWQVSRHKAKTPAELRAEFQSKAWERYSADVESAVKSQGEIACTIDGRALTVHLINGRRPTFAERLSYISRRQLLASHSFDVPIANATAATIKATMAHRSSSGAANVNATLRHHFSPKLTGQIGTTFFDPHVVDTKMSYAPNKDTFVTFTTLSRPLAAPPLCTLTYGQTWTPGITTFCTFKSGSWQLPFWRNRGPPTQPVLPSFVFGAAPAGNKWSTEIETSSNSTVLTGDYRATVLSNVKISSGFALSRTQGLSVTLTGEKRITTDTRMALIFTTPLFNSSGAVTVRVRLSRLGQKLVVPVILTPLSTAFILTIIGVPAASMTALHFLYLLPRKRRKVAAKLSELKEDNWQLLGRRRAEALDAIELLREPVARRVAAEQSRPDGLVILSAVYGPTARNGEDVDVTVAIQALVFNGALIIPGGRSKSGLLGFYDPCIGEAKRLVIRYSFRDREHEATYDDLASVTAPLLSHRVSPL